MKKHNVRTSDQELENHRQREQLIGCVDALNIIYGSTDGLTCAAHMASESDCETHAVDFNEVVWIDEMLGADADHPRALPLLAALSLCRQAWLDDGPDADELRSKALTAYNAVTTAEADLWVERARELENAFAPDMTIEGMLQALHDNGRLRIAVNVGKFGRCDVLRLCGANETVGELSCFSDEETITALQAIDETVAQDSMTVWTPDFTVCMRIGNKDDGDRSLRAVPIYKRRCTEQARIIAGSLKRGHRAFGFYPLEGFG